MNAQYCEGCGAVGESCCTAAAERQKTSTVLAGIVDRLTQENRELRDRLRFTNDR